MGASHIAANHLAADRRACKLGTDGNSERYPANSSTFAVAFTRSGNMGANLGAHKPDADVKTDKVANRGSSNIGTNISSQQWSANGISIIVSDTRAGDECAQPLTSIAPLQQAPHMQPRRSERGPPRGLCQSWDCLFLQRSKRGWAVGYLLAL
jgi:hypothetical protein